MASQPQKLAYVDAKLGAPSSGQQTTRVLFNTIEAPGTTSSLVFFRSFQGLTNGQTNLTQNRLDSMESTVIKNIWLAQLASDGTLSNFGGTVQQTFSIIVGNQTVVKNLPIQFNQGFVGQAFDRLHENGGTRNANLGDAVVQNLQPVEIRLLTDIVIPPQVQFSVNLKCPIAPSADPNSDAVLRCYIKGYGKLFNPRNNY